MSGIYEVELKARLRSEQKDEIARLLEDEYNCKSTTCIYHDTYFDNSDRGLLKSERELRLRRITQNSSETVFLTFKESPFDDASKSKNEHEVMVSSYDDATAILKRLGYSEDINFQKDCKNYHLKYKQLDVLITLVSITKIKEDFIEVEVLSEKAGQTTPIFSALHELLLQLNVLPDQITSEYYTDLFRKNFLTPKNKFLPAHI